MDKMVKMLYEKETIYEEEIDSLFRDDEAPAEGGEPAKTDASATENGGTAGTSAPDGVTAAIAAPDADGTAAAEDGNAPKTDGE